MIWIFLQIILWGRTEKCLRETCEEISMTGTECHYFVCDVGNREEVYEQAKVVREKVRFKIKTDRVHNAHFNSREQNLIAGNEKVAPYGT